MTIFSRLILSTFTALALILSGMIATPAFAQTADDYGIAASGTYCPVLSATMTRGARDAASSGQVSELQKFFADYYDIDPVELVTGYFGRITQGYVIQFQKEQGLPAFGIAGQLTRARIATVCNQSSTVQTNNTNNSNPSSNTTQVTSNTSTPSCTLSASSNSVVMGQPFYLSWTSKNATSASLEPTFGSVATNGAQQVTLGNTGSTHTSKFTLNVSGTGGSASCSTSVTAASLGTATASIDQSSLMAASGAVVSISGGASNSNAVIVALVKSSYGGSKDWASIYASHSYIAFTSNPPVVSNGRWATSFSGIAQGSYTVLVYDHTTAQPLLTTGALTVAGSPTISITASSIATSPAVTFSVQYDKMPAAGVRINNSAGVAVWTQELTTGGGGSTVVSISTPLPAGNYTAQAFGSDGTIYATSASYYFAPPVVNYTAGSGQSITLVNGQMATDGGLQITLASIATNSSGQPVANFNIDIKGYVSSFYSTAAGSAIGGGGGFADPASSTGSVTITVLSVNPQNNSATILINTAVKG